MTLVEFIQANENGTVPKEPVRHGIWRVDPDNVLPVPGDWWYMLADGKEAGGQVLRRALRYMTADGGSTYLHVVVIYKPVQDSPPKCDDTFLDVTLWPN